MVNNSRSAFTGRPFDSDTQLQNNLNRWYDASVGCWLSEDPIGFHGRDGNLYRYVRNDVPTSLDPRGLEANPLRTLWQVIEIAYNVLSMADRVIKEPLGIYGPGAGPAPIKGLRFEVQEPNVAAQKVAQTEFPVSLGAFRIVSATHAVPLFVIQVAMTQSFLGIDWVVPDSVLLRYANAEHPLTLEQIRQRNSYELPDIRIELVCQLDRSLKVSINDQSTVIRTRTGRYQITIYTALFLIPIYMPSEYPGLAVGPILSESRLLKYVLAFPSPRQKPICCYR
ncbi:MAG: RHS repeat-associated core domain-containing protein [Thermogutta sp.]|uniref:RHS repeat-associated core domain-containing protein n=1 Tax=Thermogutta sp. TaxID=1962930 RepID=UPI0019831608|nr:RHS repeat-associated core domain-containing protein [Thermogutta sp.]MBC7352742.1 RHS repeat-associated core domain-containing protein [Thermogutta sp.]